MSTTAIQRVVEELQDLPESDQQQFLHFLQELKRRRSARPASPPRRSRNPALKDVDGLLVFTGQIGDPGIDWLKLVREERDGDILRAALGLAETR